MSFSFLHSGIDGTAQVENGPFGKLRLPRPLHLDDELLVILVSAENVKYDPALFLCRTVMLCWQIGYVSDFACVFCHKAIEEVDKKPFVLLCPENLLE